MEHGTSQPLHRQRVLACSVPLAKLWAWLLVPPFVFEADLSQPSSKPSNQPQGNFITPRTIYTPKGKPGRKAVVLEDGKHTALQQESSRGSRRKQLVSRDSLQMGGQSNGSGITGTITRVSCQILFTGEARTPHRQRGKVFGAGLWMRNNSIPPSCSFSPNQVRAWLNTCRQLGKEHTKGLGPRGQPTGAVPAPATNTQP